MCPWFDFWFRRYIYCLLVYIVCFPSYPFFFTFSLLIIIIIYCYTTMVAHDTYMYIHKNIQLRNTEYKSTRIAQQNLKPNNLCKCQPNRFFYTANCFYTEKQISRPCFVALYNWRQLLIVAHKNKSPSVEQRVEAREQGNLRRLVNNADVERTTREQRGVTHSQARCSNHRLNSNTSTFKTKRNSFTTIHKTRHFNVICVNT